MSLDALFEQLKHPNPNLRKRARRAIAEQRDETTIPRLMANLEAEDMIYRRASVKALGVIGVDSVPFLVDTLLNSENSTVRASCAKGLAQVAVNHPEVPFPPEGIKGLQAGMKDSDAVVNLSSVMALGAIGEPALEVLIEALETTDNLAVAVAILNALGSIKDERVQAVLTRLSNDESADPYIKESAISALSRLDMVMKYSG
ncbi:MAG TPA: HEAT repeat domain-containing protein [Xenococcaceae cyanobacterium]|jgi:bilin biosynthesis protein